MKRIIISITIIVIIITIGCSAIFYIDSQNRRLYGKIEMVLNAYSEDDGVEESIGELKTFFHKYEKGLACIVSEEALIDMSQAITRLLPMYLSDCDEFTAECQSIMTLAARIKSNEIPTWDRIL